MALVTRAGDDCLNFRNKVSGERSFGGPLDPKRWPFRRAKGIKLTLLDGQTDILSSLLGLRKMRKNKTFGSHLNLPHRYTISELNNTNDREKENNPKPPAHTQFPTLTRTGPSLTLVRTTLTPLTIRFPNQTKRCPLGRLSIDQFNVIFTWRQGARRLGRTPILMRGKPLPTRLSVSRLRVTMYPPDGEWPDPRRGPTETKVSPMGVKKLPRCLGLQNLTLLPDVVCSLRRGAISVGPPNVKVRDRPYLK